MENLSQILYFLSIALVPFLLAMIGHEVAHGWIASKMGDQTARYAGRLTINPLVHLDPMGTLVFVLTGISSSLAGLPFVFGWAKPVPINPRFFRNYRQGMFAVSLAGSAANILMALAFAGFARLLILLSSQTHLPLLYLSNGFLLNMCVVGVIINFTLAFLNLLPIPPLDGSKIIASLLPPQMARSYLSLSRFGFLILIVLLVSGLLFKVLDPAIRMGVRTAFSLVGLSL